MAAKALLWDLMSVFATRLWTKTYLHGIWEREAVKYSRPPLSVTFMVKGDRRQKHLVVQPAVTLVGL